MDTQTKAVVAYLKAKCSDRCFYCGIDLGRPDVRRVMDHVVPKAQNGSNGVHNLVECCRGCNVRKHARQPYEWKAVMTAQLLPEVKPHLKHYTDWDRYSEIVLQVFDLIRQDVKIEFYYEQFLQEAWDYVNQVDG